MLHASAVPSRAWAFFYPAAIPVCGGLVRCSHSSGFFSPLLFGFFCVILPSALRAQQASSGALSTATLNLNVAYAYQNTEGVREGLRYQFRLNQPIRREELLKHFQIRPELRQMQIDPMGDGGFNL